MSKRELWQSNIKSKEEKKEKEKKSRNNCQKKSRIWETQNLSTDADSSTNIFVSAGVQKGANSIIFLPK